MRIDKWLRRKIDKAKNAEVLTTDLDGLPELKEHPRLYKKFPRVRAGGKFWRICVISLLLGIIFSFGLWEVRNGNLRGILALLSLPVYLLFWKFIE